MSTSARGTGRRGDQPISLAGLAYQIAVLLKTNNKALTATSIAELLSTSAATVSKHQVESAIRIGQKRFQIYNTRPLRYAAVLPGKQPVKLVARAPRKRAPGQVRLPANGTVHSGKGVAEPDPQLAHDPGFPIPPFRVRALALEIGEADDADWGIFLSRFQETIGSFEFDEVSIILTLRPQDMSADRQSVLVFNIDRVIMDIPRWISWVDCTQSDAQTVLHDAGWHLWDWRRPPLWERPWNLLDRNAIGGGRRLLATWRADSPIDISWAVLATIHGDFGVRDLSSLRVTFTRVVPEEIEHRRSAAEGIHVLSQRLRTRGTRDFKNPVGGYCANCGRPLRDVASLKHGMGRVCREQAEHLNVSVPAYEVDYTVAIPASYWVGAQPETRWRERLMFRIRSRLRYQ